MQLTKLLRLGYASLAVLLLIVQAAVWLGAAESRPAAEVGSAESRLAASAKDDDTASQPSTGTTRMLIGGATRIATSPDSPGSDSPVANPFRGLASPPVAVPSQVPMDTAPAAGGPATKDASPGTEQATAPEGSLLTPKDPSRPMLKIGADLAPKAPVQVAPKSGAELTSRDPAAAPAAAGPNSPVGSHLKTPPPPDQPLQPIPDPQHAGPMEIEAASFNGVTPGVTTAEKLQAAWGAPKQAGKRGDAETHLYAVEPFERVEVIIANKKVASIIVRLQQAFPAQTVAEQLELSQIRPVLVSSELGEILGQAYPERGVMFAFEPTNEPGKTTMRVTQIILEPVNAEPFMLRAETNLDNHPALCLTDLDQVLKMTPSNARAHWLRARVLSALGQQQKALQASAEAVRLDAGNSHYHVTRSQILGQVGQYDEAVEEAKKALSVSDRRPHVKARALCLLGDLAAAGPKHDYKEAIGYHIEAIKTADPLGVSPHPAIRLAAKDVLIDAHLGAANDIAWGAWKQKETAVPKWLNRALAFADEMIQNDGGTDEHRLRIATRALTAYVGAQGKLDPTEWTDKAVDTGSRLITAAKDISQKQQIAWDLGIALYDALQIYQMRSENEKALKYGELAIGYIEQGGPQKQQTLAYSYLLGRVYFRLGSIHAVGQQQHRTAITWFDKAVPLLSKPLPEEALRDLGRHGETFVSMAVSYWEVGQKEKALDLTTRGVALMEQAVKGGSADRSILAVPYGNLATMHQTMGQDVQAQRWAEMAAKSKNTTQQ
jgi:tetratricopeptide (TPR) repeat protein